MRLGVDTGGTFTDLVDAEGRVAKVLSTPDDPARAVAAGVDSLGRAGGPRPELLAHGTTVATNALLERRGAPVALVATEGFADVIEIARQDRPSLYDPLADRPAPLVPRAWRFEVPGRLDATGAEVTPVAPSAIAEIPVEVASVAVCLLHADLEPAHERAVRDELVRRGHDVTCSHEVSPEFREYERTVTTVINAYLRPVCRRYLHALDAIAERVLVMTSGGGLVPAAEAAELPAALLLSGPAGGVQAAAAVAAACGWPDAVTFDMGGTSTDVCLVLGGVPEPAPSREAAGFPVRLPAVDIHTIGAGGGSIARIDPGGALRVGPESAGASPGPACYGRGGTDPTVTDANLVLGRIPTGATFSDLGQLDVDAARAALERAGTDPGGVVTVVNANMERALRTVSVERGVDPEGLALVAFGGAGPLHACELADALGMPAVIVPPRAGVLSAVGLLCSPVQRDLVRSWPTPGDTTNLAGARDLLAGEAWALVGSADGTEVSTSVDCRYAGQSHELTVAEVADFHEAHRRHNGYARPDAPVEVIAVRARARRRAPLHIDELPPPVRDGGRGPIVLAEPDCTVWVPNGWEASPAPLGALVLTRTAGRR